jgi:hypothetical protein
MSYRLTNEEHFLRLELFDALTRQDLESLFEEFETIERERVPAPHRLCDTTRLERREIQWNDYMSLAARRSQAVLPNPVKSAIVVTSLVNMGFARMFQQVNNNPQIEVRIFDSEDAAVAWLRSS